MELIKLIIGPTLGILITCIIMGAISSTKEGYTEDPDDDRVPQDVKNYLNEDK